MARWYKPHEVLRMVTHDNAQLIADPDRNLVLIMKDGKVYKNELE